MKKAITYILLFAYSSMLLKPVLPYVTDVLAHTFWYANHIATVHFENGKYHVHKETVDAAKKTNTDKNATLLKSFFTEDVYLTSSYSYDLFFVMDRTNCFATVKSSWYNRYTGCDSPPPKA